MHPIRCRIDIGHAMGTNCFSFCDEPCHTVPLASYDCCGERYSSRDQLSHVHTVVGELAKINGARPTSSKRRPNVCTVGHDIAVWLSLYSGLG